MNANLLAWDDFAPGDVFDHGPQVLTADETIAFAAAFDPQPMHLDAQAASASMLGGLAGSGWHACCLTIRMVSDGLLARSHYLGMAGVDEVRWLAPLRPGVAVAVRTRVQETRASPGGSGAGTVSFLFELLDAAGARIMAMRARLLFARRPDLSSADGPEAR